MVSLSLWLLSTDFLYRSVACTCRTPEWLKKMFASVSNSERNGPVFRFFMDLGDAGTFPQKQLVIFVGYVCLLFSSFALFGYH